MGWKTGVKISAGMDTEGSYAGGKAAVA